MRASLLSPVFFTFNAVFTGRNEVLAKVNIFTPVCHSFCSHGGGCLIQISGGVSAPILGGCLLQISGGGVSAPIFWGGGGCLLQIWGGICSKFWRGCLLQIWGGVCSKFWGGVCSKFLGGVSNFRNTVNIRPVRILLECILV